MSVCFRDSPARAPEAYGAELQWWRGESPEPHVVCGDVLNPYIQRRVETDDEGTLRRVFAS